VNWEIVFKTNSDSKSIILVFPDGTLKYASEGTYGGYIIKPPISEEELEHVGAFFVEPSTTSVDKTEAVELRDRYITNPELKKHFEGEPTKTDPYELGSGWGVQKITYRYIQVRPVVKKSCDRYTVLDFEPLPGGRSFEAEAIRFFRRFAGSGKYPEYRTAENIAKELKLKHPNDPFIQNRVYGKPVSDRSSALFVKVVTKTPTDQVFEARPKAEKTVPVAIKGFLVLSSLPSKALLDAHLPEIFKGSRIGRKEIKLVMGYFYNKLGSLSRKFYTQILPQYAIYAGFGYIIPKDKVPEFLKAVDELKLEYAEYEKQLKDFLLEGKIPPNLDKRANVYREYLDLIREYLRKQGKENILRDRVECLNIVERVTVNLLPFSIDLSVLEEYVDEKVRKRVEQEIYQVRSRIAENIKKQLEERARVIIAKIEKYAEAKMSERVIEGLRNEIAEIQKMAMEFNVRVPALDLLSEFTTDTALEKVQQRLVEIKTSGRLKALLKEIAK